MNLLRMTPSFTHAELMILADAVSQYSENQDEEKVTQDGTGPVITSVLEKLTAYQAQVPQPVEMASVLQCRFLVPGPHDADSVRSAPPYAVFHGSPKKAPPEAMAWDLFDVSSCTVGDHEAASVHVGLPLLTMEPELDQEAMDPISGLDDIDAAMAYLAAGGVLCKVPDEADSPHYRLLAVHVLGGPMSGNCR